MKDGDIVKLKGTDHPKMVVRWVRTADREVSPRVLEVVSIGVICEWFDSDIRLQSHEFKPESLEICND